MNSIFAVVEEADQESISAQLDCYGFSKLAGVESAKLS